MKNIEEMTIKEAKEEIGKLEELNKVFNQPSGELQESQTPFEVGKNYLVRTVTMTIVGELKGIYEQELLFGKASWVADTGPFHKSLLNSLEKSSDSEIEPFPDECIVGRGAIVDAAIYPHDLPSESK